MKFIFSINGHSQSIEILPPDFSMIVFIPLSEAHFHHNLEHGDYIGNCFKEILEHRTRSSLWNTYKQMVVDPFLFQIEKIKKLGVHVTIAEPSICCQNECNCIKLPQLYFHKKIMIIVAHWIAKNDIENCQLDLACRKRHFSEIISHLIDYEHLVDLAICYSRENILNIAQRDCPKSLFISSTKEVDPLMHVIIIRIINEMIKNKTRTVQINIKTGNEIGNIYSCEDTSPEKENRLLQLAMAHILKEIRLSLGK